jgi:outer membrane lipoprotein-sorting protein
MKKIIVTSLALLIIVSVNFVQAQSLDDVLNKYNKASGVEKLAKAKSFLIKAKISQMGMELPMLVKVKKPNKFKIEMEMQGQKMVQAYDGENGWMIAPWISPDPQDLSGAQLKDAINQADMEGELYNYKEKGHSIEFIGKVNLDGKAAYKLKLTTKDGNLKTYFIDADSYFVIKVKSKVSANGQTISVTQNMLDYKTFDGVTMPTKLESVSPMGKAVIIMEEIKLNIDLDDTIFKKPAKK